MKLPWKHSVEQIQSQWQDSMMTDASSSVLGEFCHCWLYWRANGEVGRSLSGVRNVCEVCNLPGTCAAAELRVSSISLEISIWNRIKPLAWNHGLVMAESLWAAWFWVFSYWSLPSTSLLGIQQPGKRAPSVSVTLAAGLLCLLVGLKQLQEYFQGCETVLVSVQHTPRESD